MLPHTFNIDDEVMIREKTRGVIKGVNVRATVADNGAVTAWVTYDVHTTTWNAREVLIVPETEVTLAP